MGKTDFTGAICRSERQAQWAGLRCGLLASAAFPLLALAASPASAGCTTPDNVAVVTCSGDLSGGVSVSNSANRKLVIEQVTTNITPAAGMDGINFVPTSATIPLAELRSDLSKSPGGQDRFMISVSGSLVDGINASSRAQALLVDSTGDITVTSTFTTAQNNSIAAAITRTVAGPFDNKVYSKGDISVLTASRRSYGIAARVGNGNGPAQIAGAIRVDSTGNITSTTGTGILAGDNVEAPNRAVTADITVISRGNITAGGNGIFAKTAKGSISVTSVGNIVAVGSGINADCINCSGDVRVSNTGDITTTGGKSTGSIFAQTKGSTTVISTGALSSGIQAGSGLDAYVSNNGTVSAFGLSASSSFGKAEIRSQGDISGGAAVSADGELGAIVENRGNIVAVATGLGAYTNWGRAVITNTDSSSTLIRSEERGITSGVSYDASIEIANGARIEAFYRGIVTYAENGTVTVTNTGVIEVEQFTGIVLFSDGASDMVLRNSASVTGGTSAIVLQSTSGDVIIEQTGGAVTANKTPEEEDKLQLLCIQKGGAAACATTGGAGTVDVTLQSGVFSPTTGIFARSDQGSLTVSVTGGIAGAGGKANATKGIDAVSVSGDVAVTSVGNIAVYDTGINASSTSGKVTVISTGNVTSLNGAGIAARGGAAPVTVSAQGDVSSSLNSAIVVEGLGALSVKATGVTQGAIAGVEFGDAAPGLDGTANSLEIAATAQVRNTSADLARLAIWGRAGAETVVNSGTVTGSVDLGGGSDSFLNRTGALFITGTQVMLGAGETLTNEGNLNVGGGANLLKTDLTGNVSQSADGMFYVDFKPDSAPANRTSDVLVLTGNANLSGTVVATQWAGTKVNAEQQFVILETSGGVVTTSGLALSIAPTPGYLASLEVLNNGTQLVLKFTAVDPGPPPEPPTEIVPDWAVAAALSALNFSDTLIGCPRDSGSYAAIGEGQCLWMDSGGGYLDGDAANGNPGWDQTSWWIGGGGQVALSDVIRLGASVRYEDSSLDSGDKASTSGSLWNAGAALTYTSGPVLLAAAASAGWSTLDTHRETSAGGKVTADHDLGYAHAKLRAGYLLEYGQWYLKPLIDLDATWMSYGDFSEKGGGAGAVKADSEEDTLLSASPRLEIGGDIALENGVLLRPFLRAGATVFDDTGFGLGWRYVAGPADAPAYEARAELDQVMADVSAGFDVFGGNGLSTRLYYDGSFGETIHSHAGGFTARMEF